MHRKLQQASTLLLFSHTLLFFRLPFQEDFDSSQAQHEALTWNLSEGCNYLHLADKKSPMTKPQRFPQGMQPGQEAALWPHITRKQKLLCDKAAPMISQWLSDIWCRVGIWKETWVHGALNKRETFIDSTQRAKIGGVCMPGTGTGCHWAC